MYVENFNISLIKLKKEAIKLLIRIINTPSISKEEYKVSVIIENYLRNYGFIVNRKLNNIWTENINFSKNRMLRTILLNSHHDTVKPGKNWKNNPFKSKIKGEKIIGLGSNDAGGSIVSMITAFIYLSKLSELPYKLILSITAEEEISGNSGIISILPELGKLDLGIVGEPTKMKAAIAEKGLLILDCIAKGKTGHSAQNDGINAIYIAIKDIEFLKNFCFDKTSKLLGKTTLNVTQICGGFQHNVIPDICTFVIDIRTNELYDNKELINIIKKKINSKINPRSYNFNSYFIDPNHPIVLKAKSIGIKTYGSPTHSDQCLMPFSTIKIGVGDSSRSHTSNEYILFKEIIDGIDIYINLLKDFCF
ncbi:M20/M25/M40 family metallo-hydrolase [Blattabacterium cuenoti]